MTAQIEEVVACFHACQEGCGRKYDLIIVQVVDGSTLFYCIPCFTSFSTQVVKSMMEPEDPAVREVIGRSDFSDITVVTVDGVEYNANPVLPPAPDDEFSFTGED